MKYFTPFFIVFFISSCNVRHARDSKLILGKWKGDKTIFVFDGDTTKVNDSQIQHIFFLDSAWWGFFDAKGFETYNYTISEHSLVINGQAFEIIKLDNKNLVYKTYRGSKSQVVIDSFKKVEGLDW